MMILARNHRHEQGYYYGQMRFFEVGILLATGLIGIRFGFNAKELPDPRQQEVHCLGVTASKQCSIPPIGFLSH